MYKDKIEEGSILIKDGKIHGELLNNKKKKHVSKMETCFFILINYFNRRDESILFF